MRLSAPPENETTTAAVETPVPSTSAGWNELLDTPPATPEAATPVAEEAPHEVQKEAEPEECLEPAEEEAKAVVAAEVAVEPATTPAVEPESPTTAITVAQPAEDVAVIEHRRHIAELCEALSQATLHRIELQNDLKNARSEEKRIADDLAKLYANGVERHPLFDNPPATVAVATPAPTAIAATATPPATPVQAAEKPAAMPPDAKGTKQVRLLKTITASIRGDEVAFGTRGEILTAYVDADDGKLFLALEPDAGEQWLTAYLGNGEKWLTAYMSEDEYEVLDLESLATLTTGNQNPKTEPSPAATPADDESWRNVTIEALGIPQGICKILRDYNGIETLGQIAAHGEHLALTDLKKIGETKAEKIQECLDRYWAQRST